MSKTLKIIHPCNHTIVKTERMYGSIEMTRGVSENMHDAVPKNIRILRVDKIKSTKGYIYKNGYHYSQSISQDIIEWANRECVPKQGERYIIQASYLQVSSFKYNSPSECERCNGNGWYSSVVDGGGQMNFAEGAQKLVQDFVKIVNTETTEDGYGSDITSITGQNVYSDVEMNNAISASIAKCEAQLLEEQNKELSSGSETDDEELLEKIEVRQIYFIKEDTSYVVSVVILNRAGRSIKFNFKI